METIWTPTFTRFTAAVVALWFAREMGAPAGTPADLLLWNEVSVAARGAGVRLDKRPGGVSEIRTVAEWQDYP